MVCSYLKEDKKEQHLYLTWEQGRGMGNKCNLFSKASEQGPREGQAHACNVTSNDHHYAPDAGRKTAAGTRPKLVHHDGG
jgi:general stress protein YciG